MKFWKKGLTAAALLAVTAVTLTACGGSSEKKATEKSEDGKTKLTVTTGIMTRPQNLRNYSELLKRKILISLLNRWTLLQMIMTQK